MTNSTSGSGGPEDFSVVRPSRHPNACTPRLPLPKLGVVIHTPRDWNQEQGSVRWPLAGSYRLRAGEVGDAEPVDAISFVVVDLGSHVPFIGGDRAGENEIPNPFPFNRARSGALEGGYFNVDLAHALRLPPRPARYLVYALLPARRSNVQTTWLRGRKRGPLGTTGLRAPDGWVVGASAVSRGPTVIGVGFSVQARISARGEVEIVGTFALPEAEAAGLGVRPHRALVLALCSRAFGAVTNPLAGAGLFEDDVMRSGGLVIGSFRLELEVDPRRVVAGAASVVVSMGERVSEPVLLERAP